MKKTVRSGWKQKIFSGNISEFKDNIHEIALENAAASKEELDALKEDININGQQNPIYISAGKNGKVFDGRNRITALLALGATEILYCVAPVNYTKKQMEAEANSQETRRHKTETQKVVQAWKETKENGGTKSNKDAALKHGVDAKRLSELNSVLKMLQPIRHDELINKLFNGLEFQVEPYFKSKSIRAIQSRLKSTVTTPKDLTFDKENDAPSYNELLITVASLNKKIEILEAKEKENSKTITDYKVLTNTQSKTIEDLTDKHIEEVSTQMPAALKRDKA